MKIYTFKTVMAYWISWLLITSAIFYFSYKDEYAKSEKVEGTVVDRLIGRSARRGEVYYPQVKFSYRDSSYLFGDKSGLLPGRHSIGDRVVVIFPHEEPDKARLYGILQYWVSLNVFVVSFGIATILFLLPMSYYNFRKKWKGRY